MAENSKKSQIVLIVALFLAAGAVAYYFRAGGGFHKANVNGWFVDEESNEESVRPLTDIPPVAGKSGKFTVVREFKYSDDSGKTFKVAYWFKYTDAMKKKLEETIAAGKSMADIETNTGELVRLPAAGSKWIPIGSAEGSTISQIPIPAGKEGQFMLAVP